MPLPTSELEQTDTSQMPQRNIRPRLSTPDLRPNRSLRTGSPKRDRSEADVWEQEGSPSRWDAGYLNAMKSAHYTFPKASKGGKDVVNGLRGNQNVAFLNKYSVDDSEYWKEKSVKGRETGKLPPLHKDPRAYAGSCSASSSSAHSLDEGVKSVKTLSNARDRMDQEGGTPGPSVKAGKGSVDSSKESDAPFLNIQVRELSRVSLQGPTGSKKTPSSLQHVPCCINASVTVRCHSLRQRGHLGPMVHRQSKLQ
ncbi:hypothetical protein BS50DRAFT_581952 [Corynespora cassiicola Philippines]|uniref:Uncharacterized protein n=1 Tax=Corynespora cassiicola Philippines TaxID=1448308 RepID=A0A2T2PC63_CORCC|nr:hypothetical protein BS50DRAFT_581952 [Corynespora cassiicola Philippines]